MDFEQRTKDRIGQAVRGAVARQGGGLMQGPRGTIRRKYLIQQCRALSAQFNLESDLDAFVYSCGCEAITGLDLDRLERLADQLADLAQRVATACDAPDTPPAR